MSYSIYLDDLRTPNGKFDVICRSYNEFKLVLFQKGTPSYISFDHDLGIGKTGHDSVKLLIDLDLDKKINLQNNFKFNVHSANPVGAKNITDTLNSYLKFKGIT